MNHFAKIAQSLPIVIWLPLLSFVFALFSPHNCHIVSAQTVRAPTIRVSSLDGIKGIVSGQENAAHDFSAPHANGTVYFCCAANRQTFVDAQNDSRDTFITKANHQLVLTGQYVQTACPISGAAIDADHIGHVAGTEIAFCCSECQSQVDNLRDTGAKAELIFGDASFQRHFAKKSPDLTGVMCPLMPKAAAQKEHALDVSGGRLYFCCEKCKNEFADRPEKFQTAANFQLTQTGQALQTACPISGEKTNAAITTHIGAVEVAFCCRDCQTKVDSAIDDAMKKESIFGVEAFERGFTLKSDAATEVTR